MSTGTPNNFNVIRTLEQVSQQQRSDPNFMLSLARGLHVLLAFSERRKPATMADIARRTGLDRAVVRRCIHTLECLGMVQKQGRSFELGTNVLSLGHAYFSSLDLVQRAQPLLDTLSNSIHTNCALAMLSGSDVVYLVRSQSRKLMQRSLGMGSRLPAHCTSLGRSLLAHLTPEEIDDYFSHTERPQITTHTVTDEATLRRILTQTRKDGYVVVNEEAELDLLGISIPVHTASFPRQLALSVTVSSRYAEAHEMPSRYLNFMQVTAKQLADL